MIQEMVEAKYKVMLPLDKRDDDIVSKFGIHDYLQPLLVLEEVDVGRRGFKDWVHGYLLLKYF